MFTSTLTKGQGRSVEFSFRQQETTGFARGAPLFVSDDFIMNN
jgi:hypothetical protein